MNHLDLSIDFGTSAKDRFVFDELLLLFEDNTVPIGCLIISGESSSFFVVKGTDIECKQLVEVDLPNKHGRGGQSQKRFERLTEEARHNYITKIAELTLRIYDGIPVIIGGAAYLKDRLVERLSGNNNGPKVLKVVDIQYDKRAGLNEVLSKCGTLITHVSFDKERQACNTFMDALTTGLAVYGENMIDKYLNEGLIETLIVHDSEDVEKLQGICDLFGTELVRISDMLPEGRQLVQGFGYKVGVLRYMIDMADYDEEDSYDW